MAVIKELMYEKDPGTGCQPGPEQRAELHVLDQARGFNRLADIYLAEESSWRKKLKRQKEGIEGKD
ncbi:MAG: hypothetical protein K9N21_13515 [Deltaproteobacteria bacterium]|nr:hypothetical protein [Deltaproteobacteria bacterium]